MSVITLTYDKKVTDERVPFLNLWNSNNWGEPAMKKVFMSGKRIMINPIYITNRKIKNDTMRVALLDFSEIILEGLEDDEPGDDELIFAWARSYAAIAKN